MQKRYIGRVRSMRRQTGIAFLVVVLVLGLATLVVGGGVTIYKISKGQKPSLAVQIKIKQGLIKLKVDPEVGASLQSEELGYNDFAKGVYDGGEASNQFLALADGATPPPGFEPVTSGDEISVVSDPSLGSGLARITLSQQLQFSAQIQNPCIPFVADGQYDFTTTVTAPGTSSSTHSYAAWAGDCSGIDFIGTDGLYDYTKLSTFDLQGSGTIPLGTFDIHTGESLTWDMAGDTPLLAAEMQTFDVPEPNTLALLGLVGVLGAIRAASGTWRKTGGSIPS